MGPSGSGRDKTVVETRVEYRDRNPRDRESLYIIRDLLTAAEIAHENEALPASLGILETRQKELGRVKNALQVLNSLVYANDCPLSRYKVTIR